MHERDKKISKRLWWAAKMFIRQFKCKITWKGPCLGWNMMWNKSWNSKSYFELISLLYWTNNSGPPSLRDVICELPHGQMIDWFMLIVLEKSRIANAEKKQKIISMNEDWIERETLLGRVVGERVGGVRVGVVQLEVEHKRHQRRHAERRKMLKRTKGE